MYGLRAEREALTRQRAGDAILKREDGKFWGPGPREHASIQVINSCLATHPKLIDLKQPPLLLLSQFCGSEVWSVLVWALLLPHVALTGHWAVCDWQTGWSGRSKMASLAHLGP